MDDIEERYLADQSSAGFQEGFEKGKRDGEEIGFSQGMVEGAKVGSELGYTRGYLFAFTQLLNLESIQRQQIRDSMSRIPELIATIDSFPTTNEPECEQLLSDIRAKTKKTHSQLSLLLTPLNQTMTKPSTASGKTS